MTAKVSFKEQPSRTVRETPPPTFLFLPSSIVKKQTKPKVPSHPKPQNKKPKPKPSPGPNNPSNQETSERVHPSPAAPPPSLVKRVIKLPQQTSQQGSAKNVIFSQTTEIAGKTHRPCVTRRPERQGRCKKVVQAVNFFDSLRLGDASDTPAAFSRADGRPQRFRTGKCRDKTGDHIQEAPCSFSIQTRPAAPFPFPR